MDKIARIRRKVKELQDELEDHNYYLDNSEQALGYGLALNDIEKFLNTLSEEPDKSLDEAANEFAWKNFSNNHAKAAAIQAFKAGAEWAFGQVGFTKEMVVGYKTAGHGSVEPGIEILFFNGEFKDGDKVIVQIRKK